MADAERPKIENLRAEIHKGLNSGPAEPLDMNEIKAAARQQRKSLSDVLAKFANFSPDFMAEGRGDQEQAARDAAVDESPQEPAETPEITKSGGPISD